MLIRVTVFLSFVESHLYRIVLEYVLQVCKYQKKTINYLIVKRKFDDNI